MTAPAMSRKQIMAIGTPPLRVNVWDGSVRSGKTFSELFVMIDGIRTYTGEGAIVIFGKNRDSVYRNIFEPIENQEAFAPIRKYIRYRQGAATAHVFGKRVHVIGANDEGSESRLRGMTIGRSYGDELTVLNRSFFKQLLARMSVAGATCHVTTNPDSPAHWLKTEYLSRIPGCIHYNPDTPPEKQLTTWRYWHFTMDDNPSLTDEYKQALKSEYTGLWYKRFIQGLWVSAEGAIYDTWDEDTMTIAQEDMPDIARVLALGIDYGTTHPTRGQLLGLGADNRLYMLDEWHPTRMTDAKLSADLWDKRREWEARGWSPEFTYVDPAAASFKMQLFEDGHPDVTRADNKVIDGIRTMASLLDNGQLLISKTCTELIKELPGYRWDDKASTKGEEKPIKELDDAADSARYSVFSSRWQWNDIISRENT